MDHRDEPRHRFNEALDAALRSTVELGALVLDNVRRASEGLLENRLDVARAVIEADEEIDRKYQALEYRVFELIARQQPVAGDLRFLVSITRILYEIERSGDLAVNCAKGLVRRDGYTLPPAVHSLLARMSRSSADIFHQGLEALAALDASAGARLNVADDEVDDLVGELYGAIGERSDDLGFDTALELSRVGRYMERIGDHAVNIAEHVTFIVTGEFPEANVPGEGSR
ncbi:MAG TPA: phosphate signaling complex protein PhoU [Acidimicrobiia bacterium]